MLRLSNYIWCVRLDNHIFACTGEVILLLTDRSELTGAAAVYTWTCSPGVSLVVHSAPRGRASRLVSLESCGCTSGRRYDTHGIHSSHSSPQTPVASVSYFELKFSASHILPPPLHGHCTLSVTVPHRSQHHERIRNILLRTQKIAGDTISSNSRSMDASSLCTSLCLPCYQLLTTPPRGLYLPVVSLAVRTAKSSGRAPPAYH